jgi:hypothetical protein
MALVRLTLCLLLNVLRCQTELVYVWVLQFFKCLKPSAVLSVWIRYWLLFNKIKVSGQTRPPYCAFNLCTPHKEHTLYLKTRDSTQHNYRVRKRAYHKPRKTYWGVSNKIRSVIFLSRIWYRHKCTPCVGDGVCRLVVTGAAPVTGDEYGMELHVEDIDPWNH